MPSPKHLLAFVCIFLKSNVWIFHIFGDGKTVFICRCSVFCCTHGTIGFNALVQFGVVLDAKLLKQILSLTQGAAQGVKADIGPSH